jgi:hypothetical protein
MPTTGDLSGQNSRSGSLGSLPPIDDMFYLPSPISTYTYTLLKKNKRSLPVVATSDGDVGVPSDRMDAGRDIVCYMCRVCLW